MSCAASISDSLAAILYMQLCAVAPRTIEVKVKLNLNFAFKVSLNCDTVQLNRGNAITVLSRRPYQLLMALAA
jgi:hypothetical protein